MKARIFTAFAAVCTVFSLCSCGQAEMRDNLSAMDYVKEMGVGINLGNTMEAYWQDTGNKTSGASKVGDTPQDYEKCWGAVVTTQECIDGMKNAGFDTVRIPVYWGNMMKDDGEYKINSDYIARVKEIVDYCLKDELYAVINIHHYDEFLVKNHEQAEVYDIVDNVWTQIAEYFKDYSDYLIFEGFNEALGTPQDGTTLGEMETYAYVNAMNQHFVDSVRKTGGNNEKRMLIVSGYWTNIDNTTRALFKMPYDTAEDRLMVSVHYIDNVPYWSSEVGGEYWLSYSEEQCEKLKNAFTSEKIPVFVGECTSIYDKSHFEKNQNGTSSEYMNKILNMAVDYGFIPVLWDVNDNFYSRTEFKIKSDSDSKVIQNISEKIKNKE
ncbi:MAG: glycoside hydrolase family 5 protein [Ruminococcus sp.]|nr:glycoside hydrolase family 5 protein [Ruminococcus sp.]